MQLKLSWSSIFHVLVVAISVAIGYFMFGSYSAVWPHVPASATRLVYFLVTRGALVCGITGLAIGVDKLLRYLTRESEGPDVAGTAFYVTLPKTSRLRYAWYWTRLRLVYVLDWILFLRLVITLGVDLIVFAISFSYFGPLGTSALEFAACLTVLVWVGSGIALVLISGSGVIDGVEDLVQRMHEDVALADVGSVQNVILDIATKVQERLHHQVLVTVNYAGTSSIPSRWFGYETVISFQIRTRRANVSLIAATIMVELGHRRRAVDAHWIENHVLDYLVTEIPMKFIIGSAIKVPG